MNSAAIVDKIRYLRKLSTSSSPNEAASAAAAADKLIQKYRIDEVEIQMSQNKEDFPMEDSGFILYETGRRTQWKHDLATLLSAHYGCAIWIDSIYPMKRKISQYRLVGTVADMDIVNYMFSWLVSEIDLLAQMFCRGLGHKYSQSYCAGVVNGIAEQLSEVRKDAAKAYVGTTALACIDKRVDKSRKAMYVLHKDLKKVKIQSKVMTNQSAFDSGMNAGKKIPLGKALGAAASKKQLT